VVETLLEVFFVFFVAFVVKLVSWLRRDVVLFVLGRVSGE
jgi:hypothetical protein